MYTRGYIYTTQFRAEDIKKTHMEQSRARGNPDPTYVGNTDSEHIHQTEEKKQSLEKEDYLTRKRKLSV